MRESPSTNRREAVEQLIRQKAKQIQGSYKAPGK
jgi:hypothetical protein